MVKDIRSEGNISEWNEGNLKSMRLHEAQTIINFAKMDLLSRSPNGDSFNYELWINAVDALYGEGVSKYSDIEIEEVDKIKKVLREMRELKPVYTLTHEDGMGGTRQGLMFNKENWEAIRQMGEIFEKTVKTYNDKHGLSTKNAPKGRMF